MWGLRAFCQIISIFPLWVLMTLDTHYAGRKHAPRLPPLEMSAGSEESSWPGLHSDGSWTRAAAIHVCDSAPALAHMSTVSADLRLVSSPSKHSVFSTPTASSVLSFCCSRRYFAVRVFVLRFEQLAGHTVSVFPFGDGSRTPAVSCNSFMSKGPH